MGYQLITPPSAEPVLLAEAKLHLRVDIADDDLLIGMLITAARQYAEQLTARSFITQQWRCTIDSFPGQQNASYVPWGSTFSLPDNAILLEKGPFQSIDAIQYVDMAGITQTMPSSDYIADLTGPLARITPKFGKIWPITLPQIASVKVDFTCGYGATSTNVPEGLRNWMKLRMAALYENREELSVAQRVNVQELPYVDSLLDPYKVLRA
ncbi:head-tail connector protein [Undibacterium sp. Ji50W]|uniref:head-tail connector protein n=1 Tax=Undibacterium sp. Ji50W TaxID=3413041 RepID=UPI003BF2B626